MTYTNEMVLPRNFAQHSEDEMMYLDGGVVETFSYDRIRAHCTFLRDVFALGAIMAAWAKMPVLTTAFSLSAYALERINENLLAGRDGAITVTYTYERITVGRRSGYRMSGRVVSY